MYVGKKIIGITGGIGSGKSVISRILSTMQVPVYDTDSKAKALCNEPFLTQQLSLSFGDIYVDGKLNKEKFAAKIFANKNLLEKANSIIHPVVIADFETWLEKQKATIVGVESAILWQTPLRKYIDLFTVVMANEELRIERVRCRSKLSRMQVLQRMQSQVGDDELMARADFVIRNNTEDLLLPQVEALLEKIKTI